MVTYSDTSLSRCCLMFSLFALKNLPGAVIVDLIPVCGLGGSVGAQDTSIGDYSRKKEGEIDPQSM